MVIASHPSVATWVVLDRRRGRAHASDASRGGERRRLVAAASSSMGRGSEAECRQFETRWFSTVEAVLKLSKKGVSMSYKVTDGDGGEIATLKGCGKGQIGEVEIAGSSLVFSPVGEPWSFEMTRDGEPAATAVRTEGRKHFVIDHGDQTVELDCPFVRNKPYDVTVDGRAAGLISLSKFTGRTVTVDMPVGIPLEARLFAGWLTLRTWNARAEARIPPV
jgi:hypothetical protein